MKKHSFVLILVFLIAGCAFAKLKVDNRMAERKSERDIRYLPSPSLTQIASLGFKTAVADTFWIEALNYFGSEFFRKEKSYEYLPSYMEIILNLDPLFTMFYEWAATVFIYNALPISKQSVVSSTQYANAGVINLAKEGRYSFNVISKVAFNYALEAADFANSIPYFEMVGRIFPDKRDMLLVGSTYASHAGLNDTASDLKMEYLGFMAFEAQTKGQLLYAMQVMSSNRFNQEAANTVRSFRLKMEKDEDLKKLVALRLNSSPIFQNESTQNDELISDPKIAKLLSVNFERNWLPPELHLLLSL